MKFTDYLVLVSAKLRDAEDKGDREECIRLTNLLIETANEYNLTVFAYLDVVKE